MYNDINVISSGMMVTFTPDYNQFPIMGECYQSFCESDFKDERSIYGGSIAWTEQNAGPITKAILRQVIELDIFRADVSNHARLGYHPIIDTRVTMMLNENFTPVDLMGEELEMYQAISGWHCDGVPRKDRSSQPDLSKLNEPVYHYIVSLSSTTKQVSPTSLVTKKLEIPIDLGRGRVWDQVNGYVNTYGPHANPIDIPDGVITRFRRSTLHKSNPSRVMGWRYFFRLSFYHMPVANEFRTNNNVYLVPKGW